MADISQSNWTEADSSNTATAPDGAPESMAPSGVNNTLRAMAGAIKRDWNLKGAVYTTGGTTTAYTLTPGTAPTALATGLTIRFIVNATNTGAATLNVSSLGAKSLRKWDGSAYVAVAAGDLPANFVVDAVYNSGAATWDIVSPRAQPAPVLASNTFTGQQILAEGASVAAATTTNIWATDGNARHITGSGVSISSLGTAPQAGATMFVVMDDVNTLVHGANLALPGNVDITTAAGDVFEVYADTTTALSLKYYTPDAGVVGSVIPTQGDLIVRGAAKPERLAVGSRGYLLASDGTSPAWQDSAPMAHILFNGSTGTVRGTAFNATVTRHAAGSWTCTWTSALPTAHYRVSIVSSVASGNSFTIINIDEATPPTTTALKLKASVVNSGDSTVYAGDPLWISVSVFGR